MKLNKNELQGILETVKPGIAKKDIVEQATHFIFTGDRVVTYNDRISICYPYKTDFQCSVKGEDFYNLLTDVPDEQVEVKVEENQILITSKNVRFCLTTLVEGKVVEFIEKLNIDSLKWRLLPEGFVDGLYLCMFSASKDVSQPYLSCVSVQDNRICSSDNYRISLYEMERSLPVFLIPATSVQELVKFDVKQYSLDKAWVHFKTKDGVVFSARLVLNPYPDVTKFFPEDKGKKVTFPKELTEAIGTVETMVVDKNELERKIDIKIMTGKLVCRGEKANGWAERDVSIEYKGETFTFPINPIFLKQVLSKTTVMTLHNHLALFKSGVFKHLISLPTT